MTDRSISLKLKKVIDYNAKFHAQKLVEIIYYVMQKVAEKKIPINSNI